MSNVQSLREPITRKAKILFANYHWVLRLTATDEAKLLSLNMCGVMQVSDGSSVYQLNMNRVESIHIVGINEEFPK